MQELWSSASYEPHLLSLLFAFAPAAMLVVIAYALVMRGEPVLRAWLCMHFVTLLPLFITITLAPSTLSPEAATASFRIAAACVPLSAAAAGAFQFSDLKERCLSKCRLPGPYMLAHYRRGASGAFRLGSGHGLFCLGCCWALMLVMFAAGVAVLWWMAALTAVMVYEKTGRYGRTLTPVVGLALLALSALAFAHTSWLPAAPFSH